MEAESGVPVRLLCPTAMDSWVEIVRNMQRSVQVHCIYCSAGKNVKKNAGSGSRRDPLLLLLAGSDSISSTRVETKGVSGWGDRTRVIGYDTLFLINESSMPSVKFLARGSFYYFFFARRTPLTHGTFFFSRFFFNTII